MIFYILAVLWFAIGISSFIFMWTTDADLTIGEIPIMILFGLLGPFSIISLFVTLLRHLNEDTVLIKKQK